LELGRYDVAVLDGVDIVYASPGVPWDSELLNEARARGIPVSSEIDLFLKLCQGTVVGITGTNGKTTTTALTGEVLAAGSRPVIVGGNIGDTVLDRVHEITPQHWVVLELSSFQLESVEKPRLHVGVILNITPDHLDRHRTLERYVDLKARSIEFAAPEDFAVLNGRDELVRGLASRTRGQVVWFDQHQTMPPMPLPGRHNMENALAAAAVGRIAGLADEAINHAIRSFKGVEHRLELVGEWAGVRWFNDSKATNPEAGRVAINAFPGSPVILIAGGYGGGFDLREWVADVLANTEAVILIGASADQLARACRRRGGGALDAAGPCPAHRGERQRCAALVRRRTARYLSAVGAWQARVRGIHRPLDRPQLPAHGRFPAGLRPVRGHARRRARPVDAGEGPGHSHHHRGHLSQRLLGG